MAKTKVRLQGSDLHLCFSHMQKIRFSHEAAHIACHFIDEFEPLVMTQSFQTGLGKQLRPRSECSYSNNVQGFHGIKSLYIKIFQKQLLKLVRMTLVAKVKVEFYING